MSMTALGVGTTPGFWGCHVEWGWFPLAKMVEFLFSKECPFWVTNFEVRSQDSNLFLAVSKLEVLFKKLNGTVVRGGR